MIYWEPFVFENVTYDLGHLHPFKMVINQAATKDKPERQYKIQENRRGQSILISKLNISTKDQYFHLL